MIEAHLNAASLASRLDNDVPRQCRTPSPVPSQDSHEGKRLDYHDARGLMEVAQHQSPPAGSSPQTINPPSPSPTFLASHLLAAVSQAQSLTSQFPPSVSLSTSSPSGPGLGAHSRPPFMDGRMPPLPQGYDGPPMSSILAGFKDYPRPYGHSPSPVAASAESYECKIVEYRGAKVASFNINGETMLCLPQAFELFLKHLVGGLHTVYTKLKRLGIEAIVCNVDQVRVLRGLGAILPGVNRCKLLSMKAFDALLRDCTTARAGRPPKRASDYMTMSPSPEALFDLKKRHLENGGFPHNGHLPGDPHISRLLSNGFPSAPINPLQYMAHHMSGLGYPPLGLPGAAGPLSGLPGGLRSHPIPSPTEASPLKHPQITPETLARLHEERMEHEQRLMAMNQHRALTPSGETRPTPSPFYTRPSPVEDHQRPDSPFLNHLPSGSDNGRLDERDVRDDRDRHLNIHASQVDLRNSSPRRNDDSRDEDDRLSDMDDEDHKDGSLDTENTLLRVSNSLFKTQLNSPSGISGGPMGVEGTAPLSSTEMLLRNILGLLRVAEENARQHSQKTQHEKAELKMEVHRERELREKIQNQLQEEHKNRVIMQKRCAKLKRLRRSLQEQLDLELSPGRQNKDQRCSASPVLSDIKRTSDNALLNMNHADTDGEDQITAHSAKDDHNISSPIGHSIPTPENNPPIMNIMALYQNLKGQYPGLGQYPQMESVS